MLLGIVTGHIGKDAVIKTTPGGAKFAAFSVGTKVAGKGKEKVTEWCDITVWGQWGEAIVGHATKGKAITVAGELTHAPWVDNQGNLQAGTRIKATGLEFQGGGEERQRSGGGQGGKPASDQDLDDEIPF